MSARVCPSCGRLAGYTSMHGPFPLGRCDNSGCPTVWFTLATSRVLVTALDVGAGGPTPHNPGGQVAKGRPWEPEVDRLLGELCEAQSAHLDDRLRAHTETGEAVSVALDKLLSAWLRRNKLPATLTATAGDPPAEGLGNPLSAIVACEVDFRHGTEVSWCPECGCPGSEYKGHRRCPRCGCDHARVDQLGVPV